MTVACVLRSGGDYRPWHVRALRDGVAEHLPLPHRFVCLTDMDVAGVETVPLVHDWPGWWAKVELFRVDLFSGRVLYFDLDTAIVGDLTDLAGYRGDMGLINDLGMPEGGRGRQRLGASGVMAWAPSASLAEHVYNSFTRMADGAMHSWRVGGDQAWIRNSVNGDWDDLRELYSGQIQSWKFTCGRGSDIPENTRVICWHGTPKPWDPEVGWINANDHRAETQ